MTVFLLLRWSSIESYCTYNVLLFQKSMVNGFEDSISSEWSIKIDEISLLPIIHNACVQFQLLTAYTLLVQKVDKEYVNTA